MFDLSADVSTDLAILIAGIAVILVIIGVSISSEKCDPPRTDIVCKPCEICGTTASPTADWWTEGLLFSSMHLCLPCALTMDTSPYKPDPRTHRFVKVHSRPQHDPDDGSSPTSQAK